MQRGYVRIIAGKWRGRRLKVLPIKGLRPTPDSVRETLFNWLSSYLQDAFCLDLFAGSGALGFEALSRGAAYVEMIDQSKKVVELLQQELLLFGEHNAKVYQARVPYGLRPSTKKFTIVFLDPPYQENLQNKTAFYLEENNFLDKIAYIYVEAKELIEDNVLPANWQRIKNKKTGQVFYHLFRRESL